ncbi:MAG: hypothetical protein ACOVOT_10185 [Rubrivivax sp.]|jgi:hypothetical protein|nr:hypothetical protein [Rubrivivax sp.]
MNPIHLVRRHRRPLGWGLMLAMLALLPLRGWAEVAMHESAWTLAAVAGEPAAHNLPCHGHDSGSEAAEGSDPQANAARDCALCALCHAPSLPAAEASVSAERGSHVQPESPSQPWLPPALPLPDRPPRA